MWLIAVGVGAWLWINHAALRNRLGHYPGDMVALVAWRLAQVIQQTLLACALLWLLLSISQFVITGEFIHWLLQSSSRQ